MLLPEFFCVWKHKLRSWVPRSQHSIKTAKEYQAAFWCYRCKTIRYITFWKCQICGFHFAPDYYAQHRLDCEAALKAKSNSSITEDISRCADKVEKMIENLDSNERK